MVYDGLLLPCPPLMVIQYFYLNYLPRQTSIDVIKSEMVYGGLLVPWPLDGHLVLLFEGDTKTYVVMVDQ